MDCKEVVPCLGLWELGELPDAIWKKIDLHLDKCESCQKALEQLPEPQLPEWLVQLIPLIERMA
jgi:hypothetical protein